MRQSHATIMSAVVAPTTKGPTSPPKKPSNGKKFSIPTTLPDEQEKHQEEHQHPPHITCSFNHLHHTGPPGANLIQPPPRQAKKPLQPRQLVDALRPRPQL